MSAFTMSLLSAKLPSRSSISNGWLPSGVSAWSGYNPSGGPVSFYSALSPLTRVSSYNFWSHCLICWAGDSAPIWSSLCHGSIFISFLCGLGCSAISLLGLPCFWAAGCNLMHFQQLFFEQVCFSQKSFSHQLCAPPNFVSLLSLHSQLHLPTLIGQLYSKIFFLCQITSF